MGSNEKVLRKRPARPDRVKLGVLLQAIRGMLLITLNWLIFVSFANRPHAPGLDVMAVAPPSFFFIIGILDILFVKWVWSRSLNGWRYGITSSIVIILLAPTMILTLTSFPPYSAILFFLIDLLAIAELLVLFTSDARRFYKK